MNKQTTDIVIETLTLRISTLDDRQEMIHDIHLELSDEFDTLAREYGKCDKPRNESSRNRELNEQLEALRTTARSQAAQQATTTLRLREALAEILGGANLGISNDAELIRSAKQRVEELKLLALEQPKEEAEGQPEDDAVAEPVVPQDKTKQPRIWRGQGQLCGEHWCWFPKNRTSPAGWEEYSDTSIINDGDIFIGGSGPKPTINPAGMQLERCFGVDWVVKEQD